MRLWRWAACRCSRTRDAIPVAVLTGLAAFAPAAFAAEPLFDLILRHGLIYDGSGLPPYAGDIAVRRDRIAAIGPHLAGHARTEVDVQDRAIAPGFINMLSHAEDSLLADGRALSDLRQGVTLEVL